MHFACLDLWWLTNSIIGVETQVMVGLDWMFQIWNTFDVGIIYAIILNFPFFP